MDPGFLLIENFGRFVAMVGILASVPLFAWAGWMYMSSMGDPNRSASARNSVVCVCVGIVIIGCAFLIPGMVSDAVVAPVGGVTFEVEGTVNCDQILRDHLVLNREASNAYRINFVVQRIQAKFDECRKETWNPSARVEPDGMRSIQQSEPWQVFPGCYTGSGGQNYVAGVPVPPGLPGGTSRGSEFASEWSGRDAYNNIIVHWSQFIAGGSERGLPSDSSVCWLYISSIDDWIEGYYY